jgi:hypothetical protein
MQTACILTGRGPPKQVPFILHGGTETETETGTETGYDGNARSLARSLARSPEQVPSVLRMVVATAVRVHVPTNRQCLLPVRTHAVCVWRILQGGVYITYLDAPVYIWGVQVHYVCVKGGGADVCLESSHTS